MYSLYFYEVWKFEILMTLYQVIFLMNVHVVQWYCLIKDIDSLFFLLCFPRVAFYVFFVFFFNFYFMRQFVFYLNTDERKILTPVFICWLVLWFTHDSDYLVIFAMRNWCLMMFKLFYFFKTDNCDLHLTLIICLL